jgi:predicted dehydrogenase/NADPH:quinone reductase-like Zn-dependent oxidoreductase
MRARAVIGRRGLRRGVQVVCHASGLVRLEPLEILAPGRGEVLVRVDLSGVSPGTERARYNRLPNTPATYPFTPGYSGLGTVVEVGRGVRAPHPGDRVWSQMPHASLARVRADRCVRVPPEVGDAEAAFTTLGVIALQGVRKAGIRFGDRVAVLGRGALGILSARVARLAGASVDVRGRTTGEAGDVGAPAEPYDVVLDVTGNPDAVVEAARLAGPGGRVVLIGSSRGASPPLPDPGGTPRAIAIVGAHAQMHPETASTPGRWTLLDEAELYLSWVSEGLLAPFEPPVERIDPREAWWFYRRLGQGRPPVRAVVFDWGVLEDRVRAKGTTFRAPADIIRPDLDQDRRSARIPALQGRSRQDDSRGGGVVTEGGASSRKLGLAIVGCGEVSLRNARAVADSGVAELLWAVDTNETLARDLAGRRGGRTATEIAPALADPRVDAVLISAPHHLHEPLCLQATSAGKHVLMEKPLARTGAEAATMIRAARAAGVLLTAYFPMRCLPEALAARALVREGGLGRVLGGKVTEHLYKETSYWFGGSSGRSRSNWRSRRETSGGGVLLMNLCHSLDVLSFIGGFQAERVYCECDRFAVPGDVEDQVALTIRTSEGAIISVDASTCAPGGGERALQIWGADGQVALDDPPRFLTLRNTTLGRTGEWTRLPVGTEREARRDFVRAFASAVLTGSANPAPAEEALAIQVLIDAAYLSAERREPVVIPADPARPVDVASQR